MGQQNHVQHRQKVKQKKSRLRFIRSSVQDRQNAEFRKLYTAKVIRPLLPVLDPEDDRKRNEERLSLDRNRNKDNPRPPTLWKGNWIH